MLLNCVVNWCYVWLAVPPTIEDGPVELAVRLDSHVVLECESFGVPDPEVSCMSVHCAIEISLHLKR